MAPFSAEAFQGAVMVAGYSVDDGRDGARPDASLPLLEDADLQDKVVLVRVDHNVVRKGKISDQHRINVTLATLHNIVERGGRPILMTHIGRPYDKKKKTITISNDEAVDPVVGYLQRKLRIKFVVPQLHATQQDGILGIDTSINWLIQDLKARKIGGIYLPNTRWFSGEEDKGEKMERLILQLSGLADVFVNDAFGSWQSHASTYHITKMLPSYAGLCMQDELCHVGSVLNPKRPFLAVVAGAKYDTKIGPLTQIYKKVDKLILGGLLYNTFLSAKYGVKIAGVEDAGVELARALVEQDKIDKKIIELPYLIESETLEGAHEGQYHTICLKDLSFGKSYKYIVDVAEASFEADEVVEAVNSAKTIFVNAVMGLMPHFWKGTRKIYDLIDGNTTAHKLFAGGDTLQEFKSLNPGVYHAALDKPEYYLFTGGGTVLKIIEEGDPYGLEIVKALIENKKAFASRHTTKDGREN